MPCSTRQHKGGCLLTEQEHLEHSTVLTCGQCGAEYSHKRGFKCTFERGILHLYFNFKRQRYRR